MRFTIHHQHDFSPAAREMFAQMFHEILHKGDQIMSQITDAVATMEDSFGKIAGDLNTLSAQAAAQAKAITDLQTQLANAGLSDADKAALSQVVTDAQALAANADQASGNANAAANPPAPAAAASA